MHVFCRGERDKGNEVDEGDEGRRKAWVVKLEREIRERKRVEMKANGGDIRDRRPEE